MRTMFVTNMCPHYRIGAFETLSKYYDVEFYFFSDGREKHYLVESGLHGGSFKYKYLRGFKLFGQRITPSLVLHLAMKNYDIVIKGTNGRFALPVTFLAAKIFRKRLILWHTFWYDRNTYFHRRFALPMYRIIWRYSDAIVTYGAHGKRYLEEHGVDPNKISIAWQSVDNTKYSRQADPVELKQLRDKLQLNDRRVILFVGRLDAEKGIEYLIEAFKNLDTKDCLLVLVGKGNMEQRLRDMCCSADIEDRTRFVGFVEYLSLYLYYALADVFVLPSVTTDHFKEPWGLVVNEAMNQGVPVVATDAVGAAVGGLVADGVNGFVVKERDSGALTVAIDKILANDELHKQMSQACLDTMKDWDYEKMVSGFVEAIEYVEQMLLHS